jgi:transcriptional regulator with XRE-family HTH domain
LSEQAGISNPYLSQIERGLRRPSAEILQQIARALSIPAESLYVRAGILDATDGPDLVAAIHRDVRLSEQQKHALVRLYRSFRSAADDEPVTSVPGEPGEARDATSGAHATAARRATTAHTDSGITESRVAASG